MKNPSEVNTVNEALDLMGKAIHDGRTDEARAYMERAREITRSRPQSKPTDLTGYIVARL